MSDTIDALWQAMYDAEDNRCQGYPGECCAPPTHGSATAILAALTAEGLSLFKTADWERAQRDAGLWQNAEAEGHIVDFSDSGYGLQHPPSCRPNLIECFFNDWLADLGQPAMPPGRYRMVWHEKHGGDPTYKALEKP